MRCFLLRNGHIAMVKLLPEDASDDEAITECRLEFEGSARSQGYDGYEVWQRERKVFQSERDFSRPPNEPRSAEAGRRSNFDVVTRAAG